MEADAVTVDVLSDALRAFATGEGCTEYAAVEAVRAFLRVSEYDARVVLHALNRSGRLEQRVHRENGFVTYWRPAGKAAHKAAISAKVKRAMEYATCR